jgi:D-3-phosphoglycerate dehydrogenase
MSESKWVLAVDKLDAQAQDGLKAAGYGVIQGRGLEGSLPEGAERASILIVRSTKVTAAALTALPELKLVIRAGAGVDTIDLAAAEARGIQVSNTPGRNADAVAEMAMALLLAADRRLVEGTQALRSGRWNKGVLGQGRGLRGRTLGILGLGAVGKAMARNARGLGMEVLAWSRSLTPEAARAESAGHAVDPLSLARESDAVSVHLASTAATRDFVGRDFFSAMKPGALFVNTARGEVVDRAALVEAIRGKGLRVGLDVFAGEPKVPEAGFTDVELASLCVCAPHLGASTDQAAEAVAAEVVRIVEAFRDTGIAPNRVRP